MRGKNSTSTRELFKFTRERENMKRKNPSIVDLGEFKSETRASNWIIGILIGKPIKIKDKNRVCVCVYVRGHSRGHFHFSFIHHFSLLFYDKQNAFLY